MTGDPGAGAPAEWRDLYFTSFDNLRLYARDYGSQTADATAVLCLPGLTRNSKDFHELAVALSTDLEEPRRVVCADYRGRGRSAYDRNWRNYDLMIELNDVLHLMTAAGLSHAAIVGTSRGGLIAMLMAAVRPGVMAGVVLNDIGPKIGASGIARIKSYVGRVPQPKSWDEAADIVRQLNEGQFPGQPPEIWMNQARKTFIERNGQIVLDYDPALARPLAEIDLGEALPTLWPQFEALRAMPTLALRGENSDLLTQDTLDRMAERHPRLETLTIAGAGHAPHLTDAATIGRVATFFAKVDAHA